MKLKISMLIKAAGLMVSAVVVLLFYQFFVNDRAEAMKMAMASGEIPGDQFSLAVTLAGPEQAVCLVLFIWVTLFVLLEQFLQSAKEQKIIDEDLMPYSDELITPKGAMSFIRPLERLSDEKQQLLLPRTLRRALSRFHAGHSTEEVARAVSSVCEDELSRLEAKATAVRYVAWAIPSIGFVGTVRGIGLGLGRAAEAVETQAINLVTEALGLAFDSTFVALLISLVLMLLIHWLQASQEEVVQNVERYCDEHCVDRFDQVEIL